MPRGRDELRDYLKRCLERVEKVPLDEPWSQIRFPRQDARKRITNEKKSKRIVLATDEIGVSRFYATWEAWALELEDNPSLRLEALDEAMRIFDIRTWREEREEQQHVMGTDGGHNAE